jgi:hypothetical protein
MLVGELTTEQKELLTGQMVEQDWFFNPFLSYNTPEGVWVITTQEIDGSIYPENEWVKQLPLIDYVPLPNPSGLTENYFNQFFSGQTNN